MSLRIIISLLTLILLSEGANGNTSVLLNRLDSLIASKENFELSKSYNINELKKERKKTSSLNELMNINNRIYEEYSCFNADSARKFIDENLRLSSRLNDKNLTAGLLIKKSFLLAATGLLDEAREILSGIDSASLPHDLKKEYLGQMIYIYGLLGNYAAMSSGNGWNHYFETEQTYKDSLTSILKPEDDGYLWYLGWNAQGMPKPQQDSVMNLLKTNIEERSLNSREVAQMAYVLAILYKEQQNRGKYLEYLAKSAIADVRIGNREMASLPELAKIMFEENDLDRAYDYITYSLDASINYPNRVRALTLLPVQNQINNAYQERSRHQEAQRRGFIIALSIISGILILSLIVIFLQLKKLKSKNKEITGFNERLNRRNSDLTKAQLELAETNKKLKDLNEELRQANLNLREANYVKEEYVGYVFSICSHYIKKIEDLRRGINTKAIKKQWKEIEDATSNYQTDSKAEIKEFYDNFDSIFLHIFPDFVAEFNSLLRPEERIAVKENELLNTELRIYALIRLGISDSNKIAEFLHCSPQTVYNYRFKMRNKAKGMKEKFAEEVKNIGVAAIE